MNTRTRRTLSDWLGDARNVLWMVTVIIALCAWVFSAVGRIDTLENQYKQTVVELKEQSDNNKELTKVINRIDKTLAEIQTELRLSREAK